MMRRKMENLINPKGSHDLEQRIEDLTKQKEFLQSACRRAGAENKELKDTIQKLEKIAALTREDVLSRLRDAENYFKIEDYTEGK
jgi:cell division protein FtsB